MTKTKSNPSYSNINLSRYIHRKADLKTKQFEEDLSFSLWLTNEEDPDVMINHLNIDDLKILKTLIDEHFEILKQEGVEV